MSLPASPRVTSWWFVVYSAGGDTRVGKEMMCGCEKTADSGERMHSAGLVAMWICCVLYGALVFFRKRGCFTGSLKKVTKRQGTAIKTIK